MQIPRGIGAYQKHETLGKSQLDLLLMVYDGAIEAMQEAESAFEANERERGRDKVARAKKFVTHLYTTLDMEKGGEVAKRLSMLYVFVIEKLQAVEATADVETLGDLRAILSNVKAGWTGVREQAAPEKSPQQTVAVDGDQPNAENKAG